MIEKLEKKLAELGYNLTDTNNGDSFYSKITSVGAPSDNDGNRVYVFVEVMADGRCAIATDAFTRFGHVVIEYKELEALVNRTLEKLPERRLRIFRMHRFEGKKYTEIAEEQQISVKTVEAHISKALKILRVELKDYLPFLILLF